MTRKTQAPWRRVAVYDPGFIQQYGHHYTYNSLMRDAFAARGIPARFFFTRYLPDWLAAEFPGCSKDIVALFYEGLVNETRLQNLQRRALRHAEELGRCMGPAEGEDCLLFAHTLDPAALLGIALWRDALPAARRPRAALNVMLGHFGNEEQCRELLAEATGLLTRQGGALLFGGCRAIAEVLGNLSGADCRVLPTPLPESLTQRETPPPDGILYGVMGEARIDKNMHILPAAIVRYLAMGGQGDFDLAVTPTESKLTDAMVLLHDFSESRPDRVRLSFRHLGVDEYYARMAGCGALIVPYSYGRFRPSGLVIESVVLGVPVIALQGGILEEELGGLDNGSLFIEEATAACLSAALLRFDREYGARIAKAREAGPVCAARHGAEAVIACLTA